MDSRVPDPLQTERRRHDYKLLREIALALTRWAMMYVALFRSSLWEAKVDEAVSLSDLIYQLRGDLNRAAWQGETKDLKFVVGPIELELSVVVDSARGGGAKAALWVLDVSAEGKRSSQVTHRIKLTLQPVDGAGRPSKISGASMDGEEDLS